VFTQDYNTPVYPAWASETHTNEIKSIKTRKKSAENIYLFAVWHGDQGLSPPALYRSSRCECSEVNYRSRGPESFWSLPRRGGTAGKGEGVVWVSRDSHALVVQGGKGGQSSRVRYPRVDRGGSVIWSDLAVDGSLLSKAAAVLGICGFDFVVFRRFLWAQHICVFLTQQQQVYWYRNSYDRRRLGMLRNIKQIKIGKRRK